MDIIFREYKKEYTAEEVIDAVRKLEKNDKITIEDYIDCKTNLIQGDKRDFEISIISKK